MFQKTRTYSLIVGDTKTGQGVKLIPPLNIKFSIEKFIDNTDKVNSGKIEIYNLSQTTRSWLDDTEYPSIVFSCGYLEAVEGIIFIGQASSVASKKVGSDIITTLVISEAFIEMHNVIKPFTTAQGKTVLDVIKGVQAQMQDIAFGTLEGTRIHTALVDGYAADGTPRQIFNELSKAHKLQWRIDKNFLSFNDDGGTFTRPPQALYTFSEDSGLLEIPYRHNYKTGKSKQDGTLLTGVEFKALMNPMISANDIIFINSPEANIQGAYQIRTITYDGEYDGHEWGVSILSDEIKEGAPGTI